jgi:GTP-binding protein YchF
VTHVDGGVNPVRDVETINYELIFSDIEIVEKRIKAVEKNATHGNKEDKAIFDVLTRAKEHLLAGKFILMDEFTEEEQAILNDYNLLTTKKIMYVANVKEEEILTENDHVKALREYVAENYPSSVVFVVSAKIEAELAQLDDEDRDMFLEDLGLTESGLNQVIRNGYYMLDLITYFTAGKKECRAWQIKKGTKAPGTAGKIHSDFERGFIRAEVTRWDKLLEAGSEAKAKEMAYTRVEGKEYVVADGDTIYFRFNV